MSGPNLPSQALVTIRFTGSELAMGRAQCQFGCSHPDGVTVDEMIDIHEDLAEGMTATTAFGVYASEILYKRGPNATGPTTTRSISHNGDVEGMTAPSQVAFILRKNPLGTSGRFGGRAFWPGVPAGATDGPGLVTEGYVNQINAVLEDYMDALTAVGSVPLIYSSKSSDFTHVASFSIDPRVGTQRRRLRR